MIAQYLSYRHPTKSAIGNIPIQYATEGVWYRTSHHRLNQATLDHVQRILQVQFD
ncbi:hypothetical protein NOS3756_51180 [Nostoc sp. NIES-3756]|uniref:hypothetical protein n=1 Tax=Nostoc sp. NIES-3756 TaxID=1751286 RepID=UPI000721C7FB|nr:hypothetical protein [Nostoc sp. NIES-3756]BAT56116.1 hypothetical protein NOS3756_51180 [Nostoc sp. NIES-3756]